MRLTRAERACVLIGVFDDGPTPPVIWGNPYHLVELFPACVGAAVSVLFSYPWMLQLACSFLPMDAAVSLLFFYP